MRNDRKDRGGEMRRGVWCVVSLLRLLVQIVITPDVWYGWGSLS